VKSSFDGVNNFSFSFESFVSGKEFLRVFRVKDGGVNHDTSDQIWVHVGSRSSVFIISETLFKSENGDSDGDSSVSFSIGELFHGGSFV